MGYNQPKEGTTSAHMSGHMCANITPGGDNQPMHQLSGHDPSKTSLDPKSRVESISELYFDSRTRLEVVFDKPHDTNLPPLYG